VVVARADAVVGEDRLQLAARGRTPAAVDPAAVEEERRTTARYANATVVAIKHAAVDARRVDVDHLPAEEAARLAEQLTVGLSEVTGLQRRLRRRARLASTNALYVSSGE
jgi:hypothetical protein